ncbi:MAG: hypothetical protein ACTSQ7_15555 [Alphaproteobacteria bacterium]
MAFPAAADPTQVLEIKVKQVVFYESAKGKAAGRIARDEIELPLGIKDISPNGRLLVTIGGKDLWIPKMLTKTNEEVKKAVVDCQNITKSYATTRAFGDCE